MGYELKLDYICVIDKYIVVRGYEDIILQIDRTKYTAHRYIYMCVLYYIIMIR